MDVIRPRLGTLTQGAIFTCARADRYSGCQNHGLVLTARCDIEQDKFPVLNYIPVVKLNDWQLRDGFDLLIYRLSADLEGQMIATLKLFDVTESVHRTHEPHEILEVVSKDFASDKKLKSSVERYRDLVAQYELLGALRENAFKGSRQLFQINPKMSRTLLKELVLNKLTGYYFLPSVSPDDGKPGYVALLREASFLPRELALQISNGLESKAQIFERYPNWNAFLDFSAESFAMPIGELVSPFTEHLLQNFSNLFGRIGVKDLELSYLNEICARIPTGVEV